MSKETDAAFNAFMHVAAQAALFELKARLTADLSADVRGIAVDGKLIQIHNQFMRFHRSLLEQDQWRLIHKTIELRNKLLHAEFHEACRMVGASQGGVRFGTLPNAGDAAEILEAIKQLAGGGGQAVSDTDTRDGVFGWLLETSASNAFQLMLKQFHEAGEVFSSLATKLQERF